MIWIGAITPPSLCGAFFSAPFSSPLRSRMPSKRSARTSLATRWVFSKTSRLTTFTTGLDPPAGVEGGSGTIADAVGVEW